MTRALAVVGLAATLAAPAARAAQTSQPITLISADGRDTLDTVEVRGHEMVRLDALAATFRIDIGEDTGAGTLTVSTGSGTVILTANQPLASVDGQLVSLSAPPRRVDGQWLVPLDFIADALGQIYDQPLELRPRSRLLLVGDVRVPRISGRYRPRGRAGRLNLEISPDTPYRVTEEEDRILVQFDADAIDVVRHPHARGEAARDIRIIDAPPGLSIELGPSYVSLDVSSPPAGAGTAQLVIDLRPVAPVTTDARPAAPGIPSPSTLPTPGSSPPRADALPAFDTTPTIRTIVVDAGHGGSDDGARGSEGTLEKDVTLSVARRLTAHLERRLGVRVILTRREDALVALDRRAAIANNNKADLFISLHANSSVSPLAAGAEVFYLSIDEYGAEAREIAEREGHFLPVVGGGTREIDMIVWEMAQARYLDQSAAFARLVEEELRRRVPMSPRSLQQAPFRVLVGANMPAVLVEMGFISNPEQEQALLDGNVQASIVAALVTSVERYQDLLDAAPRMLPAGDNRAAADTAAGRDAAAGRN